MPKELPDNILSNNIFCFLLLTPKQVFMLKSVSKQWKRVVENITYLGIDDGLQKPPNRTIMAMAPVNSSGDIYHMLAFVILSSYYGHQIPYILLTYDKTPNQNIRPTQAELNTGAQVRRAISFVSVLGYKECFVEQKIRVISCSQPVARQKVLEDELSKSTPNSVLHYIDHRLTTTVIADCFFRHGVETTTAILREGFKRRALDRLTSKDYQLIHEYVEQVNKISSDKPTLVIHYRDSGKSNEDQTLSTIAPQLIKYLKEDYNLIAIYVDSRTKSFQDLKGIDIHLRPFQNKELQNSDKDLGKIAHLELLLTLYERRNEIKLCGIVGNTSGTLDLAAFIGHRVFNIHHFDYPKFDYQDYRIFLQMSFFTIQRDDDIAELSKNILEWLKNPNLLIQPKQHLYLVEPKSFSGLGKIGFSFFSSSKNMKTNEWNEQKFFKYIHENINKKIEEANFLKNGTNFQPPKPE